MPAMGDFRTIRALFLPVVLALAAVGCKRPEPGPRELLGRYFDTAVKQDYASTWKCYHSAYRAKVGQQEFVRHRREASRLQSWRLLSLNDRGKEAEAVVELSFAAEPRLNRPTPVTKTVVEQMVRESDGWRIKVF